jgi:hypothetical protein
VSIKIQPLSALPLVRNTVSHCVGLEHVWMLRRREQSHATVGNRIPILWSFSLQPSHYMTQVLSWWHTGLCLLFGPEDGGDMYLRNVRWIPADKKCKIVPVLN